MDTRPPGGASSPFPLSSFSDEWFEPWAHTQARPVRGPETDVRETESELEVTVELPGMRAEDIRIDLEDNVLRISGEKREEKREERQQGGWLLTERRYGRFQRSFVLPGDVESTRVRADYENGVLSVHIPKSERARHRRIEINPGSPNRGTVGSSHRSSSPQFPAGSRVKEGAKSEKGSGVEASPSE